MFAKKIINFIISIFYFICGLYQKLFPQTPKIVTVEHVSKKISKNYKIIQLSDFHYEKDQKFFTKLPNRLLEDIINTTNQENPDFIFLTGDFVDSEQDSIKFLTPFLSKLKSKYGIYAVFGNHDGKDLDLSIQELKKIGINILCNESLIIDELEIIGTHDMYHTDYWGFERLNYTENNLFRIILTHNPKSFFHFKKKDIKYDIQFSGHTHGGQICLPNGTPVLYYLNFIVNYIPNFEIFKKIKRYCSLIDYQIGAGGLHQEDQKVVYTNKGLGTHPPMRLFCPPEITKFYLKKF